MNKIEFVDWEKVCLDTSIIISYLAAKRGCLDPRVQFVKKLVDYLNNNKSRKSKNRQFFTSSITIAELYDKSTDKTKASKIVAALGTPNMTFVAFNNEIAEYMTNKYHAILGKEKQNEFARNMAWPDHDLLTAKEWISRDLMIIATSDYLKCDVILTLDEKTMLPVADKVDYFCSIALEKNFNVNGNYIHHYKYVP